MKKIIISILMLFSVVSLIGCKETKPTIPTDGGNDTPSIPEGIYENDVVTTKETLSTVTLANSFIEVSFNLDNGSLTSLKNKLSQTDYLLDTVGGNWAMTVDVSTGNPFATNYQGENATLVTSRNQMMEYKLEATEESATLSLTYDVSFAYNMQKYTGIEVINKISIKKGIEEVTFDYEIVNQCDKEVTICNFTGAQLTGLKDATDNLSLFWPNKEGKIYDNAIEKISDSTNGKENLNNVYPGLCSMQLIQLFNENESLYYMVKDPNREYKIANYGDQTISIGYDYNQVGTNDKVSMSFTQFPFVASNQTKQVYQTVLGVSIGQSWYRGSDRYQEFLIENDFLRNYDNFVENWGGFVALVGSHYGSKHFSSYTALEASQVTYSDWIKEISATSGVKTELVLGWNDGGFDSKYPDYDFALGDGFNGEEGFKTMSDLVHNDGNLFCCHINSRIADVDSNWSKTIVEGVANYQKAGIKQAGYTSELSVDEYEDYLICETYSTGTTYYVMSPASKEFQDQLISVVTRLRQNGCNGLWFDQLFERDAKLDYDEAHKMSENSTPATLYYEGYSYLMNKFDEIAATINPTEPWILVCGGGAGDALAKYVDVYGGNWNRKLGARDNSEDNSLLKIGTENCDRHIMSPELTKYTVPAIYIGQAGAGTLTGQTDEYARAFMFGSPFLVEQLTTSAQSLLTVYDYYPDIFYRGIYTDEKGLSISNENVMGSIILSKENKAFAIQMYNYDSNAANDCQIKIDLAKLGINGNITSATNLFTGDTYDVKNNILTYSFTECEFTSVYVTYE